MGSRFRVSQTTQEELASQYRQARRFTQVTFGLIALAALALAAVIHHDALGIPFTEDARGVVSWSFVGLAALDAALLSVWQRLTDWIANSD